MRILAFLKFVLAVLPSIWTVSRHPKAIFHWHFITAVDQRDMTVAIEELAKAQKRYERHWKARYDDLIVRSFTKKNGYIN